jgi:hypothetical protein
MIIAILYGPRLAPKKSAYSNNQFFAMTPNAITLLFKES